MKILDCFIYNNEDLILDLRLNLLNNYVDKFIIVEAKFSHSGVEKKIIILILKNLNNLITKLNTFK